MVLETNPHTVASGLSQFSAPYRQVGGMIGVALPECLHTCLACPLQGRLECRIDNTSPRPPEERSNRNDMSHGG